MATREPREVTIDDIVAIFELGSYWLGDRWCPAVFGNGAAGYGIRVIRSQSIHRRGDVEDVKTTYDYFELDPDGNVDIAPRGYARDFKPGRVADIKALVERFAKPADSAPRFSIGGW